MDPCGTPVVILSSLYLTKHPPQQRLTRKEVLGLLFQVQRQVADALSLEQTLNDFCLRNFAPNETEPPGVVCLLGCKHSTLCLHSTLFLHSTAAWLPVAATVPSRLSSKIIFPFTFRPGGGRCEIGFVGFFRCARREEKDSYLAT